jgi:hypothetical protein
VFQSMLNSEALYLPWHPESVPAAPDRLDYIPAVASRIVQAIQASHLHNVWASEQALGRLAHVISGSPSLSSLPT